MTANLTKTYLRHKSPNLLNYDIKTREKNLFNDLIIKVDNRIILDNQRVLASSSLFFEILFKTEVNEIQKSTVTIKTLNFEIMKTLVDFICDGKISIKSHNVFDICPMLIFCNCLKLNSFVLIFFDIFFNLTAASQFLNMLFVMEAIYTWNCLIFA